MSRIVRDAHAGDIGAHRGIDIDEDRDTPDTAALAQPMAAGRRYSQDDWAAALDKRRQDIAGLAGVANDLVEIDRRADEINKG